MKVLRTFQSRIDGDRARDFLMSRGIPANLHSADLYYKGDIDDGDDRTLLVVKDGYYQRAQRLMDEFISGAPASDSPMRLPFFKWRRGRTPSDLPPVDIPDSE